MADDGKACDDGVLCTQPDACKGGKCGGLPKCDDGDACTTDLCDGLNGTCSATPKVCTDNNACTDDSCNAKTSECTFVANTAACEDFNPCTLGDVCANSKCAGKQKCNDDKPCTDDACSFGTCTFTAKTCDDKNACTVDVCDAAGLCKNTADDSLKPGGSCPAAECQLAVPACSGGKATCLGAVADPGKADGPCKSGGGLCSNGACNSYAAVMAVAVSGPHKAGEAATLVATLADADNDAAAGKDDIAAVTADLGSVGGATGAKLTKIGASGSVQTWSIALPTTGLAAGSYLVPVTLTDKSGGQAGGYGTLLVYSGAIVPVGTNETLKTVKAGFDAAQSGDVVLLADGIYSGTGNRNLVLPAKALVLASKGGAQAAIIDCGGSGRFLSVTDVGTPQSVTIAGLTVKGCGAGAVRVVSTAAPAGLTLSNMVVTGNTNGDHGGAVHVAGAQADVRVVGSQLTANTLTGFGGGALYLSQGKLTVLASTVADNKAVYNGNPGSGRGAGILSLGGTVVVRDTLLSGNLNTGFAGHACAATGGTFELTRSLLVKSDAAVMFDGLTTATLDRVTAIGGDKQIQVVNTSGSVVVKDCLFAGGTNATYFSGTGKATLSSSKWLGGKGAALFVSMITEATDLEVRGVDGPASGGSAATFVCGLQDLSVKVKDSVFRNNIGGGAGTIHFAGCLLDLDGCTFSNNKATTKGGGAFIFSSGKVRNCVFSGNSSDGDGGGVTFLPKPQFSTGLSVENILVVNNTAGGNGGGIHVLPYYDESAQPLTIAGATVTGNTAKGKGGGVHVVGNVVSLSHNILWGNTDGATGGSSGDEIFFVGNATTKPVLTWTLCSGDDGKFGDPSLKVNGGAGYAPGADGNLEGDPLFVSGPKGLFYLSQTAAGQAKTSPAVNPVGGAAAAGFGWGVRTTRSDGAADSGALDFGWHWAP